LRELANQAVMRPERLASILLPYARARGWTQNQLATALGCSPKVLLHLLLARNPCPDSTSPEDPAWQAEARALARQWELDPGRLESVLRVALHFQADRAIRLH
jgi:hypothetical protein